MSVPTGFAALLATPELADLGPGPRAGTQSEASISAKVKQLCGDSNPGPERQELLRSLVLLWHDHLDSAHSIAQSIEGSDGAFVHGIMHRREPDFSNAAYWFRRVGKHEAFKSIADRVGNYLDSVGDAALRRDLLSNGQWDPFGFISACERAAALPGSAPSARHLREIQRLEFESLLEWFTGASR